jgi:hypothetical protein
MPRLDGETRSHKCEFFDPIFDKTLAWIWTSDKESASRPWSVGFIGGGCFGGVDYGSFVRAVR